MDLTGRLVHFWLSPSGREALSQVIPPGLDFEALVIEEDSVGLWIWVPEQVTQEVTLLKWEYFATAKLEYQPGVLEEKPRAGFQAPE